MKDLGRNQFCSQDSSYEYFVLQRSLKVFTDFDESSDESLECKECVIHKIGELTVVTYLLNSTHEYHLFFPYFLDGVTVDVNSNMTTIHNEFGETWAVNRRDWIFSHESFVQEILQDLEDGVEYEASYAATFDTPELEEAAKQVRTV